MTHSLGQACIDAFRIRDSELVSVRHNSHVHRCVTDSGTLAVKTCIDGASGQPDPVMARLEYTSLQQLAMRARTAGELRLCPDAIGLNEEFGAVAMTWEPGTVMSDLLLSKDTDAREGLELGKVAGTWLRLFHRMGNRPGTSNDLPEKIPFFQDEIARLPRRPRILAASLCKLERTACRAGMIPLPVSWAFGDFKSDNLLVNGRRAIAIDVELRHENSVIYNVAQFLVHLDLLRWTTRGMFKRPVLEAAAQGFLNTYLTNTDDWRLPIIWLRTIMLLQRGIDSTASSGFKGHLRRLVALRALEHSSKDLDPFL